MGRPGLGLFVLVMILICCIKAGEGGGGMRKTGWRRLGAPSFKRSVSPFSFFFFLFSFCSKALSFPLYIPSEPLVLSTLRVLSSTVLALLLRRWGTIGGLQRGRPSRAFLLTVALWCPYSGASSPSNGSPTEKKDTETDSVRKPGFIRGTSPTL